VVLALLASLAVAAGAAPSGADSGPPFVGEIGTSPDGVAVVVDPVDVAVGPGGHVFVLQAGSQAEVQELTSAGAVVRSWGGPGTGEGQFSGAAALAVGGGRVYVADQPSGAGAGRVQVFDASGGFVSSFAAGTSPSGLAVGPGGDLFLSDRGSSASGDGSVLRFGVDGTPLGPFGSVPGVEPNGLAFAPGGDLYLTDLGASSSIKRVVQLAADGSFVRAWGSRGSGSGQFTTPDGIGVDAVGRVYVADNRRVQAFTAEGAFVSSSVAYAPAGPYYSYNPLLRGLAVDAASGTVYVAQQGQAPYDRDWLEKRTTAGCWSTSGAPTWGKGGCTDRAGSTSARTGSCTWRTRGTAACRCSSRTGTSCASGGRTGRRGTSSRSHWASRWPRTARCTWRTRATTG
jgi:hypothetical protein